MLACAPRIQPRKSRSRDCETIRWPRRSVRRWLRRAYGRGPLFTRALAYWSYRYIVRLGFLDGKEGLIFHFLQGFWFRFLIDALIYEGGRRSARAEL